MIGPRAGLRSGLKAGPAAGISADEIGSLSSMAGVSRDSTSNIYVPATSGEWTTTMAAAGISSGNPSLLWLCQEASGALADSIGTFTGAVTGSPTYQTAVTGWTRKAVTMADASAVRFVNADAGLPDVNVASMLVYAICKYPGANPAAIRNVIEIGTAGANRGAAELLTTGPNRAFDSGNTANGTTGMADGGVHPTALRVNQTADTFAAFNNADKMVPTFAAGITGKAINIGGVSGGQQSMAGGYLYVAAFFNAAAELSDVQLKTLLQTLGWTIGWS